jgi:hypothetical protein
MPVSVSVLPQHPVKGSVSVTLTAHKIEETIMNPIIETENFIATPKIEETTMTDYAPTTITELKPFDGFTSFTAVVAPIPLLVRSMMAFSQRRSTE